MRTKILLMAVVVAVIGICFGADVYAQPVKALVINAAIDDIASRLRVQENQIRPLSIKSDRVNPDLFTVVLQGPNPLTSKVPDTFTYTIKVNKHPNSVTPHVQIIGVNYSDGSYDRYFYSGTLVSRIEQFDTLGNSKATILYYGKGNRSLAGRINTITHWKTENDVKTAKYTDVYKYSNSYNLRSFEVFRYKGDVWAPEAKPLCVFLYVGRIGLEKLTKCTFADGSYIAYSNGLAQAVFAAGSSTPGITFRYLDANGQPTTKNIATTVVSYFGGKFKIAHEGIIDPVDVVVEYKSRELIGVKVITDYDENGAFLEAKEICTFLTPDAPYVDEQWVLTYSDEARTNVIDAQIVRTFDTGDEYTDHQQVLYYTSDGVFAGARDFTYYYVDTPAGKRVDRSIVKYYGDEEMTELYEVQEINWDVYPGELIDCKVVVNSDENGVFISAQKILTFSTLYDSYSEEQWIWTYSDEAMTKANMLDAKIVRTFDTGDEYVEHQQILTYTPTGTFENIQDITNYYMESPSGRFLYRAIAYRYIDEEMTSQSLVDITEYRMIGDIIDCKVVVNTDENGVLLSAQKILTFDTPWQPYHTEQWIWTYDDEAMTNCLDALIVRTFDTGDEYVEHTQVLTYMPDGTFAQAKDITNYYMESPSGRFLYCAIIDTYVDENMTPQSFVERQVATFIGDFVDAQEVISYDENGVFLSAQKILTFDTPWRPYHTEQWIFTYSDEAMTKANMLDAKIVRTFDTGNEYVEHTQVLTYTPDGTFAQAQDITNYYIDTPSGRRLEHSTVYTYADEAMTELIDRKEIWNDYDYINIISYAVYSYSETGELMNIEKHGDIVRDSNGLIVSEKVIVLAADGQSIIEMKLIENLVINGSGRVLETRVTIYSDSGDMIQQQLIKNLDFDVAGRVTLQEVKIFDENGTFIEKILIENLVFDAAARITQLRVTIYNEAGQVVCWDDIWNTAFDSQGRLLGQTINSYVGDGTLVSRTIIENSYLGYGYDWYDPSITPAKRVVKNYDNLGNVTMTTQTEILARDQEGRITDAKVTIWGDNGSFIEMQMITNVSFDEYARVIEQRVATYDEDGNLMDVKVITNDYNVDPHRPPQFMPMAEPLPQPAEIPLAQEPQDAQVEAAPVPAPQPASDLTNDIISEILSKQDAIQASRAQLSGGKFQRNSLMDDNEPVQLSWKK